MAASMSSRVLGEGYGLKNAWDNVAAAQTDSVLVAAVPGKKIRVRGVLANAKDAGAVTFTFNSKPGGAGTAISPTFIVPLNGGFALPVGEGWFETNAGEGLTITTAAASALAVIVVYSVEG